MPSFLAGIVQLFLSKKKIIGYVSALLIAAAAAVLGMQASEVKEAVVQGPAIELPAPASK